MTRHVLLVATDLLDKNSIKRLSKHAKVFTTTKVKEDELAQLLPSFDSMMIFAWPRFLTRERVRLMPRLRFIQSILAGVNHIPFSYLNKSTVVCSNAGAYSDEVAEHAWALLLSSAKRIVEQGNLIREGRAVLVRHGDAAEGIRILKGKTLGILGYGGIGVSVARFAKAFEMRVYAFSRRSGSISGARVFHGERGLTEILETSDALILALPLTQLTTGIIDRRALSKMKTEAILVNVGRGELVDERAMFEHLKAKLDFRYATDVWWYKGGRESLVTDYPFATLPNFVGTLHVSGPSALKTGRPVNLAVKNTIRFLTNHHPRNIVEPSEYATRESIGGVE